MWETTLLLFFLAAAPVFAVDAVIALVLLMLLLFMLPLLTFFVVVERCSMSADAVAATSCPKKKTVNSLCYQLIRTPWHCLFIICHFVLLRPKKVGQNARSHLIDDKMCTPVSINRTGRGPKHIPGT